MEVSSYFGYGERMMVCSVVEAAVVETLFAAHISLSRLLIVAGALLDELNVLPKLTGIDESFPFDELHRRKKPDLENKDASDTEDDDDDDAEDQDDEAGDEDFSGEEEASGEEDDEEGDPEEDPATNGNDGSDDEDDDDDDDDGDDGDGGEDDDEDEEDEEEEDQPPAKKRK